MGGKKVYTFRHIFWTVWKIQTSAHFLEDPAVSFKPDEDSLCCLPISIRSPHEVSYSHFTKDFGTIGYLLKQSKKVTTSIIMWQESLSTTAIGGGYVYF